MAIQYPKQIKAKIRSKVSDNEKVIKTTLAVDMDLNLPEPQDPPMEFHANYSRFIFAIITVTETEKTNPNANLLVEELAYVEQRTNWCNEKYWQAEWDTLCGNNIQINDENYDTNRPAYKTRLAGRFSQKTAAEILTEKGEAGKKELSAQVDWLEKYGSPQYERANKEQIAAINDALELFSQGKLKPVKITNPTIVIFDTDKRYFQDMKDGLNRCYRMIITFNIGQEYPYTITIYNSYNSVKTMPDKTKRIGSENKYPTKGTIYLTVQEWTEIVSDMKDRKFQFELVNFKKQSAIMEANMWKRENQKK